MYIFYLQVKIFIKIKEYSRYISVKRKRIDELKNETESNVDYVNSLFEVIDQDKCHFKIGI